MSNKSLREKLILERNNIEHFLACADVHESMIIDEMEERLEEISEQLTLLGEPSVSQQSQN